MRWSSNEIHNFKYFFILPIWISPSGFICKSEEQPLKEWSEDEILQLEESILFPSLLLYVLSILGF